MMWKMLNKGSEVVQPEEEIRVDGSLSDTRLQKFRMGIDEYFVVVEPKN